MKMLDGLGGIAYVSSIDTHVHFYAKLFFKWEDDDTQYEIDFTPRNGVIAIECFRELVKRSIITGIKKASDDEIFHQETFNEMVEFTEKHKNVVWTTEEEYQPLKHLFFHVNVNLIRTDSVSFDMLFLGHKYPFAVINMPIEVFHEFIDRVEPRIRIPTIHGARRLKIFISHASEDKPFIRKLAEDLSKRGLSVWFDEWEIKVGDSIVDKINSGITESAFMIVTLSKTSVEKDWVRKEINAGFMREMAEKKIYLLPILVEPCTLPPLISDRKYANFSSSYYDGLSELLSAL